MRNDCLKTDRRKISALFLCLALLLSLQTWGIESSSVPVSGSNEISKHVRFLASEELMGRGVDTPGIVLARDYIANEFKKYGLLPGGDNGTYFQSFEVVTRVSAREPSAVVFSDQPSLILDRDWTPLGLSREGLADGEIVFVGYGITAHDHGYDDYAGMEVKGKIVVVLRYEPPPTREGSPFRKLPQYSRHATLNTKAANARNHGAIGMILVDLGPVREGEKELIPLRRTLGQTDSRVVAVQVKSEIVQEWLQRANISLVDLKKKIDRDEQPASRSLPPLKVSLQVGLEKVIERTENVIGILPGSNPRLKDENIVIGAHYDHIGLGYFGTRDASTEGEVHNGADDNASGTAVLLELARRLSLLPRPARTIVFAGFSAEELGIRGSRHYVEHPPFPLRSTVAMINLDMVGRMKHDQITVSGMDTAKEFSVWVNEAGKDVGVEVRPSAGRMGSSDHASFQRQQIPALHFYTGLHEDYHRPTDDWEKLNIEGMTSVSDLVLKVVQRIASNKEHLNFVLTPPAAGQPQPTPTARPPVPYP